MFVYRKIVLILSIFQNYNKLLPEIGFSERDIRNLNLEFKNLSKEQHEESVDYVKNEEKSLIEEILNK